MEHRGQDNQIDGIPLSTLYDQLFSQGLIKPVIAGIPKPPYNHTFNPKHFCKFHSNIPGHPTDHCFTLRRKIQAMIRDGQITIQNGSISVGKSLSPPSDPMECEQANNSTFSVSIPYDQIFNHLRNTGKIQLKPAPPPYDPNKTCPYHSGARGHSLQDCPSFKKKITKLVESGELKLTL